MPLPQTPRGPANGCKASLWPYQAVKDLPRCESHSDTRHRMGREAVRTRAWTRTTGQPFTRLLFSQQVWRELPSEGLLSGFHVSFSAAQSPSDLSSARKP